MFKNNDNKYATKGELNEVKEALEQNNQCLNEVRDNLNNLNTKIEVSLSNVKWLLGGIGALIPVLTTILSMLLNSGQPNLQKIEPIGEQNPQIIILDKEYFDNQEAKVEQP